MSKDDRQATAFYDPSFDPATRMVRAGQIVVLRVVDVNPTGVFLDQGQDKDLLLPHNELAGPVLAGDDVVVAVLEDSHGRPFASNQITRVLDFSPPANPPGTPVSLLVYSRHDRGFLCIVDGRYPGMLFADRTHRPLAAGQQAHGFVVRQHAGGKLDVSLQQPGVDPFADDLLRLETQLRSQGFLPLNDKSPAPQIRADLGMSKKSFKRAVGALYRTRKIAIEDDGLRWLGVQD